ncbi:unnamed protein product [Closterium sp. NIES-53]
MTSTTLLNELSLICSPVNRSPVTNSPACFCTPGTPFSEEAAGRPLMMLMYGAEGSVSCLPSLSLANLDRVSGVGREMLSATGSKEEMTACVDEVDGLVTGTTRGYTGGRVEQGMELGTCGGTGAEARASSGSSISSARRPGEGAETAEFNHSCLPTRLWQFYHPTSRRVLSSQDVTFDESVPYYRLFPYRTVPLPPLPLFLVPGPPPVDPLPPQGPAPSGVSQPGGAESEGAEPGGAEPGGAEPGGEEPGGAGSARVASRSASSRRELLSPQELREWFARRWSRAAGAGGTPGAAGTGGAAAAAGVGPAGASGAAGARAAWGVGAGVCPAGGTAGAAGGTGAAGCWSWCGWSIGGSPDAGSSAGAGVGAVGAGGATGTSAAAGGTGAVPAGSGDPARPRPYFVPLLEQFLGLPPSSGPTPSLECPQPVQSQSLLQPVSPLPAPSPYTGPTGGLAEHREPASRPASPVRAARTSGRAPRQRPPAVPRTPQTALRPSTASQRVPLPSPPASSLPVLADPESDTLRAASPTDARLLSTVVTDPSFESAAASALVAELVDFAACCRLDYAAGLVAESASVCPPSVGGECALSTDVLEDRQEEFQCFAAALPHLVSMLIAPEGDPNAPDIPTPRSYAEAIEGPYSSQWQSPMDAEMASWKSTGTYVDEVPPPGANIVSGMWIFALQTT